MNSEKGTLALGSEVQAFDEMNLRGERPKSSGLFRAVLEPEPAILNADETVQTDSAPDSAQDNESRRDDKSRGKVFWAIAREGLLDDLELEDEPPRIFVRQSPTTGRAAYGRAKSSHTHRGSPLPGHRTRISSARGLKSPIIADELVSSNFGQSRSSPDE
jgi:hypothetical protein